MRKTISVVLLTVVLLFISGIAIAATAQNSGGITAHITAEGSVRTGETATIMVDLQNPWNKTKCSLARVNFTLPSGISLKSGELTQAFESIQYGDERQASITISNGENPLDPETDPTQGDENEDPGETGGSGWTRTDGGNGGDKFNTETEIGVVPPQDAAALPQTGDDTNATVIVAAVVIACAVITLLIACILKKKIAERALLVLLVSLLAFGTVGYTATALAENEKDVYTGNAKGTIELEKTVYGDNGAEYKIQAQVEWTMDVEPINILIVGSGLIARNEDGAEHDTRLFLQSMCDSAGILVNIESIVRPNNYNLYETGLTGENQSKVKEELESRKYDYVVLQMSRDYPLLYQSSKGKDLTAVNNIEEYLAETNPDGQIVFFVPPYRNDTSTSYWSEYLKKGWSTTSQHAAGIREYMAEVAAELEQIPLYADVLSAFEDKLAQGINVYHKKDVDFPSIDGSFVAAAEMFEAIFGRSAYGLGSMSVSDVNGNEFTITNALGRLYGLTTEEDPPVEEPEPTNILIVGSGLIARTKSGAEHDARAFLRSICESADIPVVIDSVVKPDNYNLYETGLTGENQSTIKTALESKKYDYVVLQMSRDYPLLYQSSKTKDLTAVKNIEEYFMATNPEGEIVFFVPPYRNDTSTSYWNEYVKKGWSTTGQHAAGIRGYMTEAAAQMQQTPSYADVLSEFENKLAQGINVYHKTEVDFPSVDGSFIAAAEMFEAIFGKSAYGLGDMSVKDGNGKELTITNALGRLYGLTTEEDPPIEEPGDPNAVNILMVGTDLIARGGRNSTHDSRLFLKSMCEDAGIPIYIESIVKSTNYCVYESGLTGTNQSKVQEALKKRKFDFVVVQVSRDYALTDQSKADSELAALKNIEQYIAQTNPEGKLVLVVPTYRNNKQTAFWTSFVINKDWSTIKDHSIAIKAYVQEQTNALATTPIIADVLGAFEEKLAQGIQVFHKDYNDYSSVDGSFVTAATIFKALFGEEPYGYGSATVTTDADEVLAVSDKLADMYGIAHASGEGRVPKYDWSHEVITPEVEALRVVSKAFYDRRSYLQYDQLSRERVNLTDHRGNNRSIPEDGTAQKLLYTDCAYFVRMCYYNAFGYEFGSAFTTSGLVNLADITTFRWEKNDGNVDKAANDLLAVLQPGDLIVYRNGDNSNGHVLLYIGGGKLLHSTGFGSIDYNYTRKADNFESGGTVIYSTMDELLNKNDAQYLFSDKSVLAVLSPLQLDESITITENTKARVAGLQNIVVSKTTSHPDGVSANPGDIVTFTIEVKNNNDSTRNIQITETVPVGMTYDTVYGAGSELSWDMTLNAGETGKMTYSFAVNSDVGYNTIISCGNTSVNGVQINDCPVYVMKTLSTVQQSDIAAAANDITSAENGLELARLAYQDALGYELPVDSLDAVFTDVFGTPNGGCVQPTQSGGTLRSMMVEPIYGGQNTKTQKTLLGVRTSNPTTANMVAGDLLVLFTAGKADSGEVYLFLGDDKLISAKDGNVIAYDTALRSHSITTSLLGQYAFCLLRPSAVMP